MVEAIPRWLNKDTFRKYTAISLRSGNDYSSLNGVVAKKLQILLLKGDLSLDFDDSFFEGMPNLKILSLSNMNFETKLPESMRQLKKLRTLHLEGCKLGDMKVINELENLLVLSLRESFCKEELPNELGELHNLRLLDLTACSCKKPLIPVGVLNRLSKLEGLYLFDSFTKWAKHTKQESGDHGEPSNRSPSNIASTTELQELRYLNALELQIPKASQLPLNGQFLRNLDKYIITLGDTEVRGDIQKLNRVLNCSGIDVSKDAEKGCLKALCNHTNWLQLECVDFMATLIPELDDEGFRDLVHLEVSCCKNLLHLVRIDGKSNLVAFPHLESLTLSKLQCLRSICDEEGEALSGMFSNLQHLTVSWMDSLEYMIPLSLAPCNLTDFKVSYCGALKFLFLDNNAAAETSDGEPGVKNERGVTMLPSLKSLQLSSVACRSLLGLNIRNNLQGHDVFFNKEVGFPLIESISIHCCHYIKKLWSEDAGFCGFQNLREISIEYNYKLSSLGPPVVFSALVNLESLRIRSCSKMRQVIIEEKDENKEGKVRDRKIIFPRLKVLFISIAHGLESFYGGKYQLEFPSLKVLWLDGVSSMSRFAGSENSSAAFFHEKIQFPYLEELALLEVAEQVKGIWNWHALQETTVKSNPVPILMRLKLGKKEALWSIPLMICNNLSSLTLGSFDNEVVFSSSVGPSSEKEKFRWKSSELPKLEELEIGYSDSLIELFEKEDVSEDSPAATFYGQLKALRLSYLLRLKLMPVHQFKGLCSLHILLLKWEYLISADALVRVQGSLQQLEVLKIESCFCLREIIHDDVQAEVDLVFEFPRLKQLEFSYLDDLIGFSSISKAKLLLPALESLNIVRCIKFEQFWSGSIIVPRLKDVSLVECKQVERLFSSEQNKILELPSLQVLFANDCPKLRSLSSDPLIAPKLQQVVLKACINMERFSLGYPNLTGVLELPSLKEVEIVGCDGMESFCSRPVVAPNLTKVVLQDCSSMQWLLSENTAQNTVAPAAIKFLFLEVVEIVNCPKMQSFCDGVLQAPKLTHAMFNENKYSMLYIGDLNQFLRTQPR